ncbi:ESX-1 secretion system protein eccB1 [Corynebacterium atrinae]|uniref:type VII secretion protein EccB n=1 Tax=Corynebacterium atrinae TaxID=1336740 RepID=UPI0025B5DD65|nr:type VII secretion protein EccB [Corynebacterium atrinae]WJY62553.1 ESX-1 secretion system protein eccB1 [Corynebacterium atrinae]
MKTHVVPTTRAQVSGHKFLQRRVEHGLVLGDIRMIHDPLGSRRRALMFGFVAVVLVSVGAGLLAWLRPAADPGEAPILQTADGALFVRVDDTVHSVANLASARLIAGTPAEPARVGAQILASYDRGAPLGIHPAPLLLADAPASPTWAACAGPSGIDVLAGVETSPLGGHRAVLAIGVGKEWLLTNDGRAELPHPDSPDGRVMRRALGITADTPRWEPEALVLGAVSELTPLRLPSPLPDAVLTAEHQTWARFGDSITPLTDAQARILRDMGIPATSESRSSLGDFADAPVIEGLPSIAPVWVDPLDVEVCAADDGQVHTRLASDDGGVALSGEGIADRYFGTVGAAIAVDSGHGFHVVDATGLRHPVPDAATLLALGLPEPSPAPWAILRLLPQGPDLDHSTALTATY